jgi:hypothetical protein
MILISSVRQVKYRFNFNIYSEVSLYNIKCEYCKNGSNVNYDIGLKILTAAIILLK